jgi:hypothetical protein
MRIEEGELTGGTGSPGVISGSGKKKGDVV